MKNILTIVMLAAFACAFTSCAITSPKEKLLVGTWKPVKVEKYISPEDMEKLKSKNAQGTSSSTPGSSATNPSGKPARMDSVTKAKMAAQSGGRGANEGDNPALRAEERLNRLIQSEARADLVITSDKKAGKMAVITLPGAPVKATWKMNHKGTKITTKNLKTKDKYVFDVIELTENKAVFIQNLPIGGIKISYTKQQ